MTSIRTFLACMAFVGGAVLGWFAPVYMLLFAAIVCGAAVGLLFAFEGMAPMSPRQALNWLLGRG
jgi:hypothetical protein